MVFVQKFFLTILKNCNFQKEFYCGSQEEIYRSFLDQLRKLQTFTR